MYVRARSAEALGKICDARAVESLIKSHTNYEGGKYGFCPLVPCYAIEALTKIGDTRAVEPLIMSLETTDSERFLEYSESIGALKLMEGEKDMVDKMLRMMLNETLRNWRVILRRERLEHPQLATIRALGEMGGKSAVKPLIRALKDDNSFAVVEETKKGLINIIKRSDIKEQDNIIKFLESDDSGMFRMGVSMLKGILEE